MPSIKFDMLICDYLFRDIVRKSIQRNNTLINVINDEGYTLLDIAVEYRHQDIVEELLKNNANINIRDSHGYIPLFTANYEMIKFLLSQGADYTICDENNETA
jgi:ankyrin repeat protein